MKKLKKGQEVYIILMCPNFEIEKVRIISKADWDYCATNKDYWVKANDCYETLEEAQLVAKFELEKFHKETLRRIENYTEQYFEDTYNNNINNETESNNFS